jgi:hypothetical protein
MQFAKWVFRAAGIYGVIVMTPMFFLEPVFNAQGQPLTHPEQFYGFVGVTLAFQFVFLTMSRDVARFRPLIPVCLFEKAVFPAFVWPLYLMGRTPGIVTFFSTIDIVWLVLFTISWFRTKPAA